MSASPQLSVCVVNRDGGEVLQRCLRTLAARRDEVSLETVVVDNASRDGSPERVAADFPEVTLLRNAHNLGFARANNQAAAAAQGSALLFLNNDALPEPGALAGLVAALEGSPQPSGVGPLQVGDDGVRQDSYGFAPDFAALLHRVRWLRWTGRFRQAYRRYRRSPDPSAGPVERLGGAAICVRRETWERVPWDEGYLFGLEDVDWSLRLAREGPVLLVPSARVVHTGGVSSDRHAAFVYAAFERGYARFLRTHDPRRWVAPLWKLLVTLDQPLRLAGASVRLLLALVGPRSVRSAWRRWLAVARFTTLGLPGYWLS